MGRDGFSQYHPGVNFLFFLGAIGFGVVVQHPAYLAVSLAAGCAYYCLLQPGAVKRIFAMVPVFLLLAALNPLLNPRGQTVLFTFFGRPYTWQALCYGLVLSGMLMSAVVWFACFSRVLTSDKLLALFGQGIPALSMLFVMVLRMVPALARKARQIRSARMGIGKAGSQEKKEQLREGLQTISSLTDWALEGSIVTADSMGARGYGCGRRTSFRRYRVTSRDVILLAVMGALVAVVLATGNFQSEFLPELAFGPVNAGLAAYGAFLLLPVMIQGKEALQWHICISRI